MEYLNAFWVGGLICALAQILMEKTKMLPGRIMVTLVCTGAVLGAIGIYQPLMDYAGAGASVPLLGFGNLLWKGMKEAVDQNGFIGLFMGGFTSVADFPAEDAQIITARYSSAFSFTETEAG